MTAKKSVGATQAADPGPTKTRQSTHHIANTGLSQLAWIEIIAGLQLLAIRLNMKVMFD